MGTKVNKRRGACLQSSFVLDSGPIGLQYEPEYRSPLQSAVEKVNELPSLAAQLSYTTIAGDTCVPFDCMTTDETEHKEAPAAPTAVSVGVKESSCRATAGCADYVGVSGTEMEAERVEASITGTAVSAEPVLSATCAGDANASPTTSSRSVSENVMSAINRAARVPRVNMSIPSASSGPLVRDTNYFEWQVVKNKSAKRYKLIGQKGCAVTEPNGKFRAADVKVPLLISNVSKDTSEDDIITYIKDKTSEIVALKMINMKKNKEYNAYKLFVSKSKLNLFLDDNFWPNGITFRRFVRFMYKTRSEKLGTVSK
ncbi:uncharacterized protein LOC114365466 [Ostrinia furnacalis]|uniref:uncharacterized protein LOC114365466 n=1 Tax=Ostrinia furnacalis TaxID=93504 RepID=UPI00103EF3C5|nr:uncharacterized protein LOC114365466 [Ostrinia furnacalis]